MSPSYLPNQIYNIDPVQLTLIKSLWVCSVDIGTEQISNHDCQWHAKEEMVGVLPPGY